MPTVTPVPTPTIQMMTDAVIWGFSNYGLVIAAAFVAGLITYLLAKTIQGVARDGRNR